MICGISAWIHLAAPCCRGFGGIRSSFAPVRPEDVAMDRVAGEHRWCESRDRFVRASSDEGPQDDVRRICVVRGRCTKSARTDDGEQQFTPWGKSRDPGEYVSHRLEMRGHRHLVASRDRRVRHRVAGDTGELTRLPCRSQKSEGRRGRRAPPACCSVWGAEASALRRLGSGVGLRKGEDEIERLGREPERQGGQRPGSAQLQRAKHRLQLGPARRLHRGERQEPAEHVS